MTPATLPRLARTGQLRYRWGDTNRIDVPVEETVRVVRSDLLFLEDGLAWPASELALRLKRPMIGDELVRHFARNFLGVAFSGSSIGEVAPIPVATTGSFEFDGWPAVARIGAMVSPEISPDRTLLRDQRIQFTADGLAAIGRVDKFSARETTIFVVRIQSGIFASIFAGAKA